MSHTTLLRSAPLMAFIRAALINGCRFYDDASQPLEAEDQILAALAREGRIEIDDTARVPRTSVSEQLILLKGPARDSREATP